MQIIADCHDSGVKGGILAIHAGKLQELCIIRAGARLRIAAHRSMGVMSSMTHAYE